MVSQLLRLRWLSVVVAFFTALHAVAFIAIGVLRGFEGYRLIFAGPPWTGEQAPGVYLAKSVDAFLLAMVFVVFSLGITTLFVARPDGPMMQRIPAWMRVANLSELKFLIWEAILAALVVASVEGFVVGAQEITWTSLILPLAILILAAGLFLARKAH